MTPGKKTEEPGLKTTSGKLNYCMFTHRKDSKKARIDVDPSDLNAGVFHESFFDITKSFGRTKDSKGHV